MFLSGLKVASPLPGLASLKRTFYYIGMVIAPHPVCLSSLGLGVVLPELRFKDLQGSRCVSLTDQENLKRGLMLDQNALGCGSSLSHLTQQAAGSLFATPTIQQLSFPGLSDRCQSRDTGNCQRRVRLLWLAKRQEHHSSNLAEVSTVIWTSNYHEIYQRYKLSDKRFK